MSIIKAVQDFLSTYQYMEMQPISRVLTDRPEVCLGSYALAPAGNEKTSTDIAGNRTYRNSYVFYAKAAAADEIDRQDNHAFLEDFSDWLEEQDCRRNYPALPDGYAAESLSVANALLLDLDEDGTGVYQVQIQFVYKKRSKSLWQI